jgi:hypothetical protein
LALINKEKHLYKLGQKDIHHTQHTTHKNNRAAVAAVEQEYV